MAYIGPAPASSIIATSDIEDDAITTAKIVDSAVTSAKTSFTTGTFSSDVTGLTVNATGDTSAGDNAAIGYTAAEGLILSGQGSTDDVTVKNDADTTILNVATGATDVEVSAGNILFGTASKGVYLGVTSATAANLLDDYEEGVFTGTLYFGENDNGDRECTYTKIGNAVRIAVQILADSSITGTGAVQIRGLPFTNSAIGVACAFYFNDRIYSSTPLGMYVTGTLISVVDMPSSTSDTATSATQAIFGTGAGKWISASAVYYV